MALLLAIQGIEPEVKLDYVSRQGIQVDVRGVPLLKGSFFQVYEPGWSKGYYSSNWNDQVVTRTADGVRMTTTSTDKLTEAEFLIRRTKVGFTAEYTVTWRGPKTAHMELSLGHLWAKALEHGSLRVGEKSVSNLTQLPARSNTSAERKFGEPNRSFVFEAPSMRAEVDVQGGNPADLFDARNYVSDWSENRDLFWFGMENVPLEPNRPTRITATWKIDASDAASAAGVRSLMPKWQHDERGFGPYEAPLPMVPKPKQAIEVRSNVAFVWGRNLSIKGAKDLQPPVRQALDWVTQRFEGIGEEGGQVELSIQNMNLPAGAYRLNTSTGRLVVTGQDREGVRNGLMRAATLSRPRGDRLIIPAMTIEDYPAVNWRGIHLFVGPEALQFQSQLMDGVLAPMLYNQVVLQAERTNWDAIRGTEGGWTMQKKDLAQLVARYRASGIEPTPLIQSFGHMGWLFLNGKNKDLMFNTEVPFSIDPRVPRTQVLLRSLWQEVMGTFKSDIMHFGLDEVDMRGWPSNSAPLVTELWKKQTGFLAQLAEENNASMMVWGDKMLAPGEAPDATHGHTKADAKARRDALPRGAFVADWHYKNDANPSIYTSLGLFKKEGLRPVASTWYRPNNIKGFFAAAANENVGTLHTTWAGYESNEANMVREFDQLSSYILAGEYAWSNRSELPKDLPYNPDELVQRIYDPVPQPIRRSTALQATVGTSSPVTVGNYVFQKWDQPVNLFTKLNPAAGRESKVRLPIGQRVRRIVVLMTASTRLDPMTTMATLTAFVRGGAVVTKEVKQGRDIRSLSETMGVLRSPRKDGMYAVELNFATPTFVESLEASAPNPLAGPSVHAITLVP